MSFKGKTWVIVYKDRMRRGLEYCRLCNITKNLTFDHIVPKSCEGGENIENITILCNDCNVQKGCQYLTDLENQALTWPPDGCRLVKASELRSGDKIAQGRVLKTEQLKDVIQVLCCNKGKTRISEFNNDFSIVIME